ncbi:hypothetical protein P4O66_001965 [Electrophorus voltai]|uniref:Gypsy retrotransposon integrase-like protein 1 n=1 Tax=Electrophorus voltai TaxID=2609070 RepID=A0AAD8ZV25_9TELE|nr:hypothetical protein P4O66_001965 [Electrophorus voltai]
MVKRSSDGGSGPEEAGDWGGSLDGAGTRAVRAPPGHESRATGNPPCQSTGAKGLIATPEAYGGDPETCEGFVVQYELFLEYQFTDQAKVFFVISRLTGKACTWGAALVTNEPLMSDYSEFVRELRAMFHHPHQGRLCGQALLCLRQGLRLAADYTMEFRILVAGTRWNEHALISTFLKGRVAGRTNLQTGRCLIKRGSASRYQPGLTTTRGNLTTELTDPPEEPMQLGSAGVQQRPGEQKKGNMVLYNLIWVKEKDEWKTSFSTSTGHYEYLVLPYGLATAPSIFQAYINEVLREYLGRSVIAYIDNILTYSSSWSQHVFSVQAMLQTLLRNHLYCKVEKSEFHHREIDFLGYVIQEGSMHMQPGKVETTTKRLNARQARWSIIFSRFKFCITYRPGERNTRADVLSQQHHAEALPMSEEPVLPPSCFLPSLEWDLDQQIKATNPHLQCPANHLYVPPKYQGALITWAHTSVGMGHAGATHMAQLIGTRYWWPAMHKDVVKYVASCTDCARSKTPCMPPVGKLLPLPTPLRPWSHLTVDFVTDLPASEGNMVVLIVVDRFSKSSLSLWQPCPLRWRQPTYCSAKYSSSSVCQSTPCPTEAFSSQFMSVERTVGQAQHYGQPNILLSPTIEWTSREG